MKRVKRYEEIPRHCSLGNDNAGDPSKESRKENKDKESRRSLDGIDKLKRKNKVERRECDRW
jgi:hypothetical protein